MAIPQRLNSTGHALPFDEKDLALAEVSRRLKLVAYPSYRDPMDFYRATKSLWGSE